MILHHQEILVYPIWHFCKLSSNSLKMYLNKINLNIHQPKICCFWCTFKGFFSLWSTSFCLVGAQSPPGCTFAPHLVGKWSSVAHLLVNTHSPVLFFGGPPRLSLRVVFALRRHIVHPRPDIFSENFIRSTNSHNMGLVYLPTWMVNFYGKCSYRYLKKMWTRLVRYFLPIKLVEELILVHQLYYWADSFDSIFAYFCYVRSILSVWKEQNWLHLSKEKLSSNSSSTEEQTNPTISQASDTLCSHS